MHLLKLLKKIDGAHLSGIWEVPHCLTFVSPSSSFHLVFFWIASHGRVPAAGLHPNSLHGRPMRWRCLMPCGLHSAISGILAGGILGFGTADRLLFFCTSTAILLCCLVVYFIAFCKIQFISLIHRQISCPSCSRARPSRWGLFGVVFVLLGCLLFCFGCWLVCFSLDTPFWTCWTVYWSTLSFDSPMREHTGLCTIRSMAQTLCYDLARAEKAKDGKKKQFVQLAQTLCYDLARAEKATDGKKTSVPMALHTALALIEQTGRVPESDRISDDPLWRGHVKSWTAELSEDAPPRKPAEMYTTAILLALELTVVCEAEALFVRALSWVVLCMIWGAMRCDDMQAVLPHRSVLSNFGLRLVLGKSKTTGPDKVQKEVSVHIFRTVSLTGEDWLRASYDLWLADPLNFRRDYMVMEPNKNWTGVKRRFLSPTGLSSAIGRLLGSLSCPGRTAEGWELMPAAHLLPDGLESFYSGHSPRNYLTSVAAALGFHKDERAYLGRWSMGMVSSEEYVRTSRQVVFKIQRTVNKALVEGSNEPFHEDENIDKLADFAAEAGANRNRIKKRHTVLTSLAGEDITSGSLPHFGSPPRWLGPRCARGHGRCACREGCGSGAERVAFEGDGGEVLRHGLQAVGLEEIAYEWLLRETWPLSWSDPFEWGQPRRLRCHLSGVPEEDAGRKRKGSCGDVIWNRIILLHCFSGQRRRSASRLNCVQLHLPGRKRLRGAHMVHMSLVVEDSLSWVWFTVMCAHVNDCTSRSDGCAEHNREFCHCSMAQTWGCHSDSRTFSAFDIFEIVFSVLFVLLCSLSCDCSWLRVAFTFRFLSFASFSNCHSFSDSWHWNSFVVDFPH